MNSKFIGKISLAMVILLLVWMLFLTLFPSGDGQINTVDDLINNRTANLFNQKVNFVFSIFLVLLLTALFANLYLYFKNTTPEWCTVSIVFVPAFAVLALVIFSLNVFFMPYLAELYKNPQYQNLISEFLKPLLPGEVNPAAEFFSLPFIFLAVPSFVFGILLLKERKILKAAGILIFISGIEYASNLISIFGRNVIINTIGMIGGLSFMVSLVLLSIGFLWKKSDKKITPSVS